jgi:protein-L-isoaspartate(D-aspartate) O-methyltransferase
MATDPDVLSSRLETFADRLSAMGAIRSPAIAAAFATVRRDRCVESFFGPDGLVVVPQDVIPQPGILDLVYADAPLVTRLNAATGTPLSSSSQPSLVARMLEALQLTPSLVVLEVGAGTGYNAALIATVTGSPVVTVDADGDVAELARSSIERLGLSDLVTVVVADGFEGHGAAAPYDRLIVTCGCTGLSPQWLDQLAGGGLAVVPLAHGGMHPIVAVRKSQRSASGQAVMCADFMFASGQLSSGRSPMLADVSPSDRFTRHPDLAPKLAWDAYTTLWFYLAARDHRITRLTSDVGGIDLSLGTCTMNAAGIGTAVVQMDGSISATGDRSILRSVVRLIEGWDAHGRPPLTAWTCAFSDPAPVHVPVGWQLN